MDRRVDGHRLGLSASTLRWIAALPAAFLTWFFLWPVARITWIGLTSDTTRHLDWEGVAQVAGFTVGQAAASTVLTVLLGLPIAGVFARYDFPLKRTARAILTIPFVLPTVVVAAAFLAFLGPRGIVGIDLEGTLAAILIAHVFYNVAVVVRVVGAMWETLDPRLHEAATVLGATRARAFLTVTLPLLRPALLAAAALVFLFTFTSFGVVLILGGLEFQTIEVAIYNRALVAFDLRAAAVLSLLQLIGVGSILGWYARHTRRTTIAGAVAAPGRYTRVPSTPRERIVVSALLTVALGATLTPLAVLVQRSLAGANGLTLEFYRQLANRDRAFAVPPTEAIANSLRFAVLASVLAVVVGGTASVVVAYGRGGFSRAFDAMLMLPLGTSAVTVGFGFLVALDRPVDLRASFWIVPIAHALVAIPFVVRTVAPVMTAIQHRLREAAAVLGAPPWRVFREVDLPLVSRALFVGAAFAFAISLGEFGATTFIARPDNPTLPIAIERFLGRPGASSYGQAMAMAAILMVVTGVSVALIDRRRSPGGV